MITRLTGFTIHAHLSDYCVYIHIFYLIHHLLLFYHDRTYATENLFYQPVPYDKENEGNI